MVRRSAPCPCGLAATYAECCGALHRGERVAATPEELMRSRYTAFAVGDSGYLLRTWSPDQRPRTLALDPHVRWVGLEVSATSGGGPFHVDGTVEFCAHYLRDGEPGEQRERSRFVRTDGRWLYHSAAFTS